MPTAGASVLIAVVELQPSMEAAYSRFLATDPTSLIYGTLEFRAFLRRASGGIPRCLVAVDNERIVGALPYFVAHDARWGAVINSLPWYGSHGGCIGCGEDVAVRGRLLEAFREEWSGVSTAFGTLVTTPAEHLYLPIYASALAPTALVQRVGQITDLPKAGSDAEGRLERMCRGNTRNLIRKSLKQGFSLAEMDDDQGWQFLYETHVANMSAISGQAKPLQHFVAMRETIPPAWRQLLVTKLGSELVGALLLFRFNRTVEYITPVIREPYRSQQPLSFAIWHAMLDAIRRGFTWWNWGGTWASQRSLHHFKKGWGAVDRPYAYLTTASQSARVALRSNRQAVLDAYPYYFIYPFELLDA